MHAVVVQVKGTIKIDIVRSAAILAAALFFGACAGETEKAPASALSSKPANVAGQAGATTADDRASSIVGDDRPEERRPSVTVQPPARANPKYYGNAPELEGLTGWLNSEPITLRNLQGKVALVDFWTYTCINCIRTLPYLKEWHERYADHGLVIVGVHTPEFEFEKKHENVQEAVVGFGLEYAVAQDNDRATWNAYNNHAWPAKYLIDRDGRIRYVRLGEGAYVETEEKIRELLTEAGAFVESISVQQKAGPEIDPAAREAAEGGSLTRELYAGFERNYSAKYWNTVARADPPYVANSEFYDGPDRTILYEDPGDHQNNRVYLHGLWHSGPESLTHARTTNSYDDYLAIRYFANSVNVVMDLGSSGGTYEVRVTIDGGPLAVDQAGVDVRFDDDGHSYIPVDGPRMYGVVKTQRFEGHSLKLSSNSDEFSVFAYTFGAYLDEP